MTTYSIVSSAGRVLAGAWLTRADAERARRVYDPSCRVIEQRLL